MYFLSTQDLTKHTFNLFEVINCDVINQGFIVISLQNLRYDTLELRKNVNYVIGPITTMSHDPNFPIKCFLKRKVSATN